MCLNRLNPYAGVVINAYMEEFRTYFRLEEPHEEFLVIDETVVATKEKIKQKPAEKSIEKLKLIVAPAEQK